MRGAVGGSPRRIVSLYPSGTETLYALGLGDRVVGRTSWCPQPAGGVTISAMGGTKDPDLAAVRSAAPDLVLACRDENRREDVEAIAAFAPVVVTDPRRVADVPTFIRKLAGLTGAAADTAEALATQIEGATARLAAATPGAPGAVPPGWPVLRIGVATPVATGGAEGRGC